MKTQKSFTLVEILIVTALIVLILAVGLFILNPKRQIEKTQDAKRKAELSSLKKTLEDWYNDHHCYPKPTEICYDASIIDTCHICGPQKENLFKDYLSRLPCDPQYPKKNYLYQVDDLACPSSFKIYTTLSSTKDQDPEIVKAGCANGCGPSSPYIYNYGVSSPNTFLNSISQCVGNDYYCYLIGGLCNHCGDLNNCLVNCTYQPLSIFSDNSCTRPCVP